MPTIRDLLIDIQSPQAALVGNLVKRLGIIETAQAGFSSDYLKHEYEVVAEDPVASVRAVNGSIVASSGRNVLASIQLPQLGLLKEIDQQIVKKYGSIQNYIADPVRSEQYIRSVLQVMGKMLVYGDNPTFGVEGGFKGLHQIAKANGKVIGGLAGTNGSRTTAFVVNWSPGETQIVLPRELNTLMVQGELVGGGTLQAPTADTTTAARKLLYGAYFYMNGALQTGNDYSVAAIAKIDNTAKITAAILDEAIDAAKGMADGSTFIYVNRRARRQIKELKNTKLEMAPNNFDYNTVVGTWDGIPIVLEESILDTETTALD